MAITTFGIIHKEESQTQGYSEVHLCSPVCGGWSLLGPGKVQVQIKQKLVQGS